MTSQERSPAQEAVEQLIRCDDDKGALGAIRVFTIPDDHAPAARESLQYYRGVAEQQDFYTAVYRLPFADAELYVLMLIPDGNDGWFEAYTAEGELVGAGQYVSSTVAWASVTEVRACAVATSLPESILPALRRQIVWEMQPDGNCRSACGRFHINQSGGHWSVVEFPGDCATLGEAQELAQMLEAYYQE